mgnify:CR=1 FL=1
MKKVLSVAPAASAVDAALLIARVGIALLMLTHGLPKMAMLFSGDPVQFPSVLGFSPELSLGLTVFAEVFCSLLLLAGLGTRLAVVPLIVTMLVAAFVIHAADPFAKQEPALYFLLVYLVLLLAGSGKYSVDYLLQPKGAKTAYAAVNERKTALSSY